MCASDTLSPGVDSSGTTWLCDLQVHSHSTTRTHRFNFVTLGWQQSPATAPCCQQHARFFCTGLWARITVFSLALSSCSFSFLWTRKQWVRTDILCKACIMSSTRQHILKSFKNPWQFSETVHTPFAGRWPPCTIYENVQFFSMEVCFK